jgi:HEAT repeats
MLDRGQQERAPKRLQVWRHGGIVWLAVLLAAAVVDPTRGSPRQGGPLLSIQDNRLSATLDRVPLRDVLSALAHEAPFKISIKGEVEKEPISISLHDVELEQGLRRLLRGISYAMTYEPASSASATPDRPRLVELMVIGSEKPDPNSHVQSMGGTVKAMPLTQGTGSQPFGTPNSLPLRNRKDAPGSTPTDPSPEQHPPASDDPGQRVEALRTLGQQRSPELETTLGSALDDPQEEVRATALEVLRDTGSAVPVERITRLAREDGNAQLRIDALALLADHAPDAAWEALESALQDAEPSVREHAESLLEEVESQTDQTGN